MSITKFVIIDILKSKVMLMYLLVLAIFSWSIFSLEDNTSKGIMSLLNIILLIVPLVAIIFSTIYMYNSTEFIELLVSQPLMRSTIWKSLFWGLSLALTSAFIIGIGLPVLIFVPMGIAISVILSGIFITVIFVALAMLCAILMRDKARGIGGAIIVWLFLSLIYDGLILFFMFQYADYPIEKPMVLLTALNPIDLARVQVLLQVDVSALMGYTGAIFKKMFGSTLGYTMAVGLMFIWAILPFILSIKLFNKKDL